MVSYVLTWWQFREAKKARARQYFNDLVLTQDFRQFLGALFKLHSTLRTLKTRDDLLNNLKTVAQQKESLRNLVTKLSDEGTFFFTPETIEIKLQKVTDMISDRINKIAKGEEADFDSSAKELALIAFELKKTLGIGELESLKTSLMLRIRTMIDC